MRRSLCWATAAVIAAAALTSVPAAAHPTGRAAARHVLVISVDGMHQSDLNYFVRTHPRSTLAGLVAGGTEYTNANTTFPSDSFPGMVAQFTGADAGTSGVYYDDTYNPSLLAPGTTDCTTAPHGTEVAWTEAADRSQDPLTLDAGQGLKDNALTTLPANSKAQTLNSAAAITRAILTMTPTPQALLNPAALPVDPATCLPVYPHQYLRVNTVFEVARQHGLRTAWSDKHPAYEILSGRSGTGIQDLFTPEINSVADATGDDWTTDNSLTQLYDHTKVAAVVNEINGFDHSGRHRVGTPAVFGLNFQSVSTGQKLPTSDGKRGGYLADGRPGPVLTDAMSFVDRSVGSLLSALRAQHLTGSTTIILSAKHGQAPIDPTALRRVDDGAIIDGLNAAWRSRTGSKSPLVAFSVADDAMLLWLRDRSADARNFVSNYLMSHTAPANLIDDPAGTHSATVRSSGLRQVLTGDRAAAIVGARAGDRRTPDVIGLTRPGVVFTGGVKKIAEHGGDSTADRHVPLIVAGAGAGHAVVHRPVRTAQIAPTILTLLGLDPWSLSGARLDRTSSLPV